MWGRIRPGRATDTIVLLIVIGGGRSAQNPIRCGGDRSAGQHAYKFPRTWDKVPPRA